MQSKIIKPHSIQPVKNPLVLPYLAAVLIVSNS